MVKNTTGGSHFKKMSRKQNSASFNYDALNNPNIINVSVSKALGNSRFRVLTNHSEELMMHIPGRFSGRNKHRNFVTVNSIVKVQLREYEQPVKNCDYLQLVQPTTPPQFFVNGSAAAVRSSSTEWDEQIIFAEEDELNEESVAEEHIMKQKQNNGGRGTTDDVADLEALENINFDDI